MVVKNRKKHSVGLKCSKPGGPFKNDNDVRRTIVVQSGCDIWVPVEYRPVSGPGEHSAILELIEEGKDGVILRALLSGRCA